MKRTFETPATDGGRPGARPIHEETDMADLSIECGCGRKMAIDALRGRGAYRCGCGTRVKVVEQTTGPRRCAAPGCRTISVDPKLIVPLCREHRDTLARYLAPLAFANWPPSKWLEYSVDYAQEFGVAVDPPNWMATTKLTPRGSGAPDHRVYFVVIGDKVKIGTTQNIRSRLNQFSLTPDAQVAVTVPGSYELESELHKRFMTDRITPRGEWFWLSPEIKEFIAEARRRQGLDRPEIA